MSQSLHDIDLGDAYERVAHARTDVQAHLPRFVELVQGLDAQVVIELGVRWGVSAVAWLRGLAKTGGHLWAVDTGDPPFIHRDMTFVQGWSTDDRTLARLPTLADVVFIDTDHTFELTLEELRLYSPLVADGGALVLHDTAVERFEHHGPAGGHRPQPPYPVRTAIETWLGELGAVGALPAIDWYHDSHGLAVIWPNTCWVSAAPDGYNQAMRIELTVSGLSPEKAKEIPNLRVLDTRNGKAVFEWGAGDDEPPRDYGSASVRARESVEARGGQVIEFRPLDDSASPVNLEGREVPAGEPLIITADEPEPAEPEPAARSASGGRRRKSDGEKAAG